MSHGGPRYDYRIDMVAVACVVEERRGREWIVVDRAALEEV